MRKKKIIRIVTWSIVGVLLLFVVIRKVTHTEPVIIEFQQDAVMHEPLYMEVSATGTINPIDMVDVGTQVSGEISEVLVDYNDQVKKGQVLALMDKRNLASSLQEASANLLKAQTVLEQTQRNMERMQQLYADGVIPKAEFEDAVYNFDNANAAFKIAKLQLDKNTVNLGYAKIVSPIDGIVISRNIDVGQTVAAAFSTPVLFTIARDLKDMKIEASVDEADIGQVRVGQHVTFTVDSYPDQLFTGIVSQVQLKPTVIQNVVTYKVIILISNADLKLLPGMTATLIIQTDERANCLTVPNSALSFDPSSKEIEYLQAEKYTLKPANEKPPHSIWVLNGKSLEQIEVNVEFTNGIKSAISGNIDAGDSVVTNLKIKTGEEKEGSLFSPPQEEEED